MTLSGEVMALLRAATSADADTTAHHRYPGETGAHLGEYGAWLPQVMQDGQYLGWLAEQDREVIGGAGLLLMNWQPSRHDSNPLRARVVNVFVAGSGG